MKTYTYVLPSHWANYLINEDVGELTATEHSQIAGFLLANNLHRDDCVSCGEFDWFAWCNDATQLGGSVTEFKFVVA